METWHEIAWKNWREEITGALPAPVREAVGALDETVRTAWIARLQAPVLPCARTMAHVVRGGSKPWILVPGLSWDIAENERAVFIAYPEAYGNDPLAMAAAGLVWAQSDPGRMQQVIAKIGAAALWAAWEGQFAGPLAASLWREFVGAYGEDQVDGPTREFFSRQPSVPGEPHHFAWGDFPDYRTYYEQLVYGVVPHDPGGSSPRDIPAVLTALHFVPQDLRRTAAQLAFKAVEGQLLSRAWRRAAPEAENVEGGLGPW